MNSKMREALTEAITEILRIDSKKRSQGSWATERDVPYIIDQIISRYGDLEFTRDEVRGMLATFGRETHDSLGNKGCSSAYITQEANKILARHTEGEKSLREYVSDIQGELILLTRRVAAIDDPRVGRLPGFVRALSACATASESAAVEETPLRSRPDRWSNSRRRDRPRAAWWMQERSRLAPVAWSLRRPLSALAVRGARICRGAAASRLRAFGRGDS